MAESPVSPISEPAILKSSDVGIASSDSFDLIEIQVLTDCPPPFGPDHQGPPQSEIRIRNSHLSPDSGGDVSFSVIYRYGPLFATKIGFVNEPE
jgi:hypothetical protein